MFPSVEPRNASNPVTLIAPVSVGYGGGDGPHSYFAHVAVSGLPERSLWCERAARTANPRHRPDFPYSSLGFAGNRLRMWAHSDAGFGVKIFTVANFLPLNEE